MAKKKPHKIELDELQRWIETEDVTFASSDRERKSIISTLNGTLKVMIRGKIIWQGTDPLAAVEAYNSITEKYIDEDLKNFRI
jgi:hypothetical protein